jgi:hypothetical protein
LAWNSTSHRCAIQLATFADNKEHLQLQQGPVCSLCMPVLTRSP